MWSIIPGGLVWEDPRGSSSKAWGLVLENPCDFIIPGFFSGIHLVSSFQVWFGLGEFMWFHHFRFDLVSEDPYGFV